MTVEPGAANSRTKDPLVEDAKGAILDFDLDRLHQTYIMVDFETFREDYRYIYRNASSSPHSVAPLLWRNRAVQANMYVLDKAGGNLIYLPHDLSNAAIQVCIEDLFQKGLGKQVVQRSDVQHNPEPPTATEIAAALAFESSPDAREKAYAKARELSARFPDVPEFSRAATLLQFSLGFYLPLALFDEPILPSQMAFLRHGVDIYRRLGETPAARSFVPIGARLARFTMSLLRGIFERTSKRWRLARLFFGRQYDFEVPLALDAPDTAGAQSFHLRVVIPPGLRVAKPVELLPTEVFEGKGLLRFASFDESNLYIYFRRNDIREILDRRDSVKGERTAELEEMRSGPQAEVVRAIKPKLMRPTVLKWLVDFLVELRGLLMQSLDQTSKVHMRVSIPLSFARGLFTLIAFLWVPVTIMLAVSIFRALNLDIFIAGLSVLFVVMLTIGIFAIDRRVLRGLVLAHATMALATAIGAFVLSLVL